MSRTRRSLRGSAARRAERARERRTFSQDLAWGRGSTCWPDAAATAAATSMTPQPRPGLHLPWPEAVALRMLATSRAVSAGLAAQTSAAAPAVSGLEKDVPLAQP